MASTHKGSKLDTKEKNGEENRDPGWWTLIPLILLLFFHILFQLYLIFASPNDSNCITIGSHNLHSFKKSSAFHKSCLETYGGIWMGQELWLMERQLPLLAELGVQFAARSGMENAVSSGVHSGRPFGGSALHGHQTSTTWLSLLQITGIIELCAWNYLQFLTQFFSLQSTCLFTILQIARNVFQKQ